MKKPNTKHKAFSFLFLILAIGTTQSVCASDLLVCDRTDTAGEQTTRARGAKSYSIEINRDEISLTRIDIENDKPEVYRIADPGLYSYFGSDSSETQRSNEKRVYFVRFDIEGRKKLSAISPRTRFRMAIAFSFSDLFFSDEVFAISDDDYLCKKL